MVSRNTWIAIIVAMVLSIVAEFFVHHEDAPWYMIKGFYAVFGFVSCVLIIVISKAIGRWFLDQPETYYDVEEDEGASEEEVHHG